MKKLTLFILVALIGLMLSPKSVSAACDDAPAPGVDWSWCNKSLADLTFANLRYADLTGTDLNSANLRHADLTGANLRYAELTSANLTSATLISAILTNANLSNADLRFAYLAANLSNANLTNANLSSANLTNANLSNATGNVVNGHLAIHSNTTCPSGAVRSDPDKCWTPTAVTNLQTDATSGTSSWGLVALLVGLLGVLTTAVGLHRRQARSSTF